MAARPLHRAGPRARPALARPGRRQRIAIERIVGIGGVFLRARDADALRAWYAEQLGLDVADWGGTIFVAAEGDRTVWAVFHSDTAYFPAAQQVMVNFRVRDLDAMLAQLRAAGAAVADETHASEQGRFGWVTDPEGNRIELWQPPDDSRLP